MGLLLRSQTGKGLGWEAVGEGAGTEWGLDRQSPLQDSGGQAWEAWQGPQKLFGVTSHRMGIAWVPRPSLTQGCFNSAPPQLAHPPQGQQTQRLPKHSEDPAERALSRGTPSRSRSGPLCSQKILGWG